MTGVIRADCVPDFIRQATAQLAARQAAAPAPRTRRSAALPAELPFARARKVMALRDHGRGVYENADDGSIWYRDGDVLRRRAQDRERVIGEYLKTLEKETAF